MRSWWSVKQGAEIKEHLIFMYLLLTPELTPEMSLLQTDCFQRHKSLTEQSENNPDLHENIESSLSSVWEIWSQQWVSLA